MVEWSTYQEQIYAFVEDAGTGNGVVNAVAGSGKTTTLVECGNRSVGNGYFCAFNRHIADELGRRLPTRVKATTIHQMGYATLKKSRYNFDVQEFKYRNLCQAYLQVRHPGADKADLVPVLDVLEPLVAMARLTLTDAQDPAALMQMALEYDLDIGTAQTWDVASAYVPAVLGPRYARSMPRCWHVTGGDVPLILCVDGVIMAMAPMRRVLRGHHGCNRGHAGCQNPHVPAAVPVPVLPLGEDAYVQRAGAADAALPGRDEARGGMPAVCYVGPPAAALRPTRRPGPPRPPAAPGPLAGLQEQSQASPAPAEGLPLRGLSMATSPRRRRLSLARSTRPAASHAALHAPLAALPALTTGPLTVARPSRYSITAAGADVGGARPLAAAAARELRAVWVRSVSVVSPAGRRPMPVA